MMQHGTGRRLIVRLGVVVLGSIWGTSAAMAGVAVLTPGGAKASEAQACVLATPDDRVVIDDGQFRDGRTSVRIYKADASGVLPLELAANEGQVVVVLHSAGFAQVDGREIARTGVVRLTPWATLDGIVRTGSKPAAQQMVHASYRRPEDTKEDLRIDWWCHGVSDETGNFHVGRVIPGRYELSKVIHYPGSQPSASQTQVLELKPGEAAHIELGGGGRRVTGQIAWPNGFPADWLPYNAWLLPYVVTPGKRRFPAGWFQMSDEDAEAWSKQPEQKAEDERLLQAWNGKIAVGLSRTGQITAEDVPSGQWRLTIDLLKPPVAEDWRDASQRRFARVHGEVVVPPGPEDQAVVLTKYHIRTDPGVQAGEVVPPFVIPGLTMKEAVKLADYSGRVVVLFFWSHSGWGTRHQLPVVKEFYTRHREDQRVAVIGINLDWDLESARAAAVESQMDWPNAHPSGKWQDDEIPAEYGTDLLDQVWVIGRDGRLIQRGWRKPEEIRRALEAALEEAPHHRSETRSASAHEMGQNNGPVAE